MDSDPDVFDIINGATEDATEPRPLPLRTKIIIIVVIVAMLLLLAHPIVLTILQDFRAPQPIPTPTPSLWQLASVW